MAADSTRRGDLDGRGNLSHEELVNFCRFFLQTAIEQVEFMAELLDTKNFITRMSIHIQEEIALKPLPKGSFELLREAWLAGEFKRGQAAAITGYKERADAVERWLPNLYPAAGHRVF